MSKSYLDPVRIAIIGAGNVGATTAYALLLSGLAAEIVLIDVQRSKAEGQGNGFEPRPALCSSDSHLGRRLCGLRECSHRHCRGRNRLDLIKKNVSIFQKIIPEVVRHAANAILLIATNPVDVLTYASWKLSGFPPSRVIGSGTILDTARFRYLLGQHFGIDPQSVHAYIIGEHGDSEVPVWSLANIAGIRLREFCQHEDLRYDEKAMRSISRQTRTAGYDIVRLKGATDYAVATGVVRIVEAILRDENSLLTISSPTQHYGIIEVCLSLPTKVNRRGADHILHLPLNEEELSGLVTSAGIVKAAIATLNLDSNHGAAA
jgi:L-lactate dehydrogenase